jgi:hypothetical protein
LDFWFENKPSGNPGAHGGTHAHAEKLQPVRIEIGANPTTFEFTTTKHARLPVYWVLVLKQFVILEQTEYLGRRQSNPKNKIVVNREITIRITKSSTYLPVKCMYICTYYKCTLKRCHRVWWRINYMANSSYAG